MRTTNPVWKRILSLAMVLFMVLSYVPGKASAAEVSTGTLLTAEVRQTTSGGTENPDKPGETLPKMHTYTITVTDKYGIDVTEKATIAWTGAPEGFAGASDKAEYGPIPDGIIPSATVTYNGMVLKNVNYQEEATWSVTVGDWTLKAGDPVEAPSIAPNGYSRFDGDPQWTFTKGEETVAPKTPATVGHWKATLSVGGETFVQEATVDPAPITVTSVSPDKGWYTKIPEVTVYGTNNTDLANSVRTIEIDGTSDEWKETGTGDQKYSVTFTPTEGKEYAIGGSTFTWKVDAVSPTITIGSAFINNKGETEVSYTYTVGASGATIYVNNQPVENVVEGNGMSGKATVSSATNVTVKITNNAGASAEATENVTQAPQGISYNESDCRKVGEGDTAALYVKSSPFVFNLTMEGGVEPITWKVNGTVVPVTTQIFELSSAGFEGGSIEVIATDSLGRTKTLSLPKIVADSTAPEIKIGVMDGETVKDESSEAEYTETYGDQAALFCKSRSYQITVSDDVEIGSATATLTYTDGEPEVVDLTNAVTTVPVASDRTLTSIVVNATDWTGTHATTITRYTNVTTDTIAPVITGEITVTAEKADVSIINFFTVGDKNYLKLDPAVEDGNGEVEATPDVTVTVKFTVTDANRTGEEVRTETCTVKKNEVVEIPLNVSEVDKAGNPATAPITITLGESAITLNAAADGSYSGSLWVDRRAPEDGVPEGEEFPEAPVVTLKMETPEGNVEFPGVGPFTQDIVLHVNVTDPDSGLPLDTDTEKNEYTFTATYTINNIKNEMDVTLENGVGSFTIPVAASGAEDNNCTVSLTIKDSAGNSYCYTKTFAVDVKAPVVKLNGTDVAGGISLESYYQEEQVLNFTMTDLNPSNGTVTITINGAVVTKELTLNADNVYIASFELKNGDKLTGIEIKAVDQYGNMLAKKFEKLSSEVDTEKPVIEISDPVANEDSGIALETQSDDVVTYYNQPVKVNVTVTDKNLVGNEDTALTYVIDGKKQTVSPLVSGQTYTVTVEKGQTLSSLKVIAKDAAGWTKDDAFGSVIAVDTEAPKVEITKTAANGKHVQTDNNKSYYDGPVTFSFSITDEFINAQTKVTAVINGEDREWADVSKQTTKYTGTITVNDGETLESIRIVAKDEYGRDAEVFTPYDGTLEKPDYTFNRGEGNALVYEGPQVVVDTGAPGMTMELSGNVTGLQEKNGVYYILLNPVNRENGEIAGESKPETVTLKIKVTDPNLSATSEKNKLVSNSDSGVKWILGSGEATYTETFTVNADDSQVFSVDVVTMDMLGHPTTLEKITWNSGSHEFKPAVTGGFTGTFLLDRRTPTTGPDEEAPTIALTEKAESGEKVTKFTIGDLDLYGSKFTFTATVTDGTKNGDAGLMSVTHSLNGASTVVDVKEDTWENSSGLETYTVNIPVVPLDAGETDSASVTVKAVDNVGNTITYTKTFAFDNQAPDINVSFDNDSPNGNGHFNTRTATVSITDLHMPEDKLAEYVTAANKVKNGPEGQWGTWQAIGNNTYVNTYTMSEDGEYDLVITAKDILENTAVSEPISFVVDNTAPTVTVERVTGETPYADNIEVMEGKTPFTADFYQSDVVYRVTVEDLHFEKGSTATLTYTIRKDGKVEENTVDLVNKDNYGTTSASFEIPVTEGQMLTDLSIQCKDDVNNWAENVTGIKDEFTHSETDGKTTIRYIGHATIVKNLPPQVTVTRTRTADMIQSIPGEKRATEYFDTEVTYTVLIQDKFLDTKACSVKLNGTPLKLDVTEPATASGVATAQVTFTVTDKDGVDILEALDIQAIDQGGKTATMDSLTIVDELNGKDTGEIGDVTFAKKDNEIHYTGPKIIVDTKAPTAKLILSGKVEGIVEKNGVYYVKLTETVDGKDGTFQGAEEETVTLTLVVTDKNLTMDKVKDNTFISSAIDGKGWTLDGETATYTDFVTAKLHDAQYVRIDVSMFDLAGHGAILDGIWGGGEKAGTEGPFCEIGAQGTFDGTVSLDRRTPSTVDENVPRIELTPNSTYKALNGLDLYGSSFDFNLHVTDGNAEDSKKHAGLNTVKWTLTDEGKAVVEDHLETPFDGYTLDHDELIRVNAFSAETGAETDQAVLVINATDNVGNHISYKKAFAFDNLAPRVTVTVSGESVRGNEYFNQTRTAVVEITDLHMPEVKDFDQYVTVNTQGTASGWVQDGITYRNTYTFDRDGEYTIEVTAKDILGNTAAGAAVTYLGEHAQQFVVDKTNPVIRVDCDDGILCDDGVEYYAKELTAYVTITERNFSAADVAANFVGGTFALGNWSADLDHRSSVTFGEGNNYSFTIDFVDLAGNRAVTQTKSTFSVDTTAPTITITRGSLENKGLNIVQGDLTLGLTIRDEQQNLVVNDCVVTVTRLDNSFKSSEVSGSGYYSISEVEDRTVVTVDFAAIAKEKGNDGVYTVKVTAKDYAGNTVELTPELVFSLNRFGSTFTTNDDYTKDFLAIGTDGNAYHASVDRNLVIQEINPNMVWRDASQKDIGSALTVVVNGTSTQLEEGKDYALTVTQEGTGENTWFVFTYEIDPDVFRTNGTFVDGRYSILLYSEDEAGNKNTNESNEYGSLQKNLEGEYTGKVEFTLDTTPPIITTTGIEEGKTYNEEFRRLDIFLSDNTPYQIVVYLNDTPVTLSESADGLTDSQTWLVWDETVGGYVLNVPEQNTLFGDQNVRIVATDAAGNSEEHSVEGFHISTNLFVRFVNSVWFIIALAVLLLLLIALVVLLLVKRRNKAAV